MAQVITNLTLSQCIRRLPTRIQLLNTEPKILEHFTVQEFFSKVTTPCIRNTCKQCIWVKALFAIRGASFPYACPTCLSFSKQCEHICKTLPQKMGSMPYLGTYRQSVLEIPWNTSTICFATCVFYGFASKMRSNVENADISLYV